MKHSKTLTYHSFESAIRAFISRLLNKPMNAYPNDLLASLGFTDKSLIKSLRDKGIISRKEKILDKTNSDKEEPYYEVKYTFHKDNFNQKINDMFKNIKAKKQNIRECDCGGAMGGCCGDVQGATNSESSGQFLSPLGLLNKGSFYNPQRKNKKDKKKKFKTVYMTESQLAAINDVINTPNAGDYSIDETSTTSVGDFQYDVPMSVKKSDPTSQRGIK